MKSLGNRSRFRFTAGLNASGWKLINLCKVAIEHYAQSARIVRIISSICSIGIGGLGFFGIAHGDYSETLALRTRNKANCGSSRAKLSKTDEGDSGSKKG
jgi:hypothetical protein